MYICNYILFAIAINDWYQTFIDTHLCSNIGGWIHQS